MGNANVKQAKSRQQQHEQATILRNISQMGGPQGMAMRGPNGLPMAQQNDLARKAMQNNGGRNLYVTQDLTGEVLSDIIHRSDAQIRMMQQRQQQMQMQRGGSDMDARMQGAGSPGSGEGAPSPSKRPRIDGAQFNGPMGMQTGRGTGGMSGPTMAAGPGGPQNPMMLPSGMSAGNLAAQQFQNYPGQGGPGAANKAQIQQYTSQLAQHQQAQKAMVNPNGPQGQGSPMMQTGPDGQPFYSDVMVNGGRPGQPAAGANGQTGSHALQDYQMQLMLLEQQNKKRLLMARQEQDSMSGVREGPPNPNGQPFPSTSPNGARSVNSPNPNEMMKRGTPQMAAGQMPSPEGQSRGSPASINFMAQNMDPNQAAQFYNKNPMNGMDMGMAGPNGMRQPPSSHPAGFNNAQMNQQQVMNMQRQQQQQAQQQPNVGQVPGWNGANAAPMMQQQGSQQGSQSGSMGTPQQRAMPPPSVPAAAQAQNGRTQPSSPQQTPAPPTPSQAKKANPKAKKETKPKVRKNSVAEPEGQTLTAKQRKAGQAAAGTTGATPAGDAPEQPPTPTPQTPITPAHPMNFGKNGQPNNGQGGANNSQPAAPVVSQPPISQPQASDASNQFQMDEFSMVRPPPEVIAGFGGVYFDSYTNFFLQPMDGMDFAHPMAGSDVLQDFDFDSFLHNDSNEAEQFNFVGDFGMEGEVGAE